MTRILIVEDDSALAESICQALALYEFEFEVARTSAEIDRHLEGGPEFDLVIADADAQGIAPNAIAGILAIKPTIPVIVISERPRSSVPEPFGGGAVFGFLRKPFSSSRLLRLVNCALLSCPSAEA